MGDSRPLTRNGPMSFNCHEDASRGKADTGDRWKMVVPGWKNPLKVFPDGQGTITDLGRALCFGKNNFQSC